MAGADMGLGAGYGAGGVADAIRNILEQRQLAAQLAELSRHNQADEALTGRKIDEEAAYRKMQSDALQQDRSVREASTIAGSLSPGDSLLSSPEQTSIPPIANRLAQGGQAPNIGVVPPLSATALPGGAETPSLPSGMGMGTPPPTGGILRTGPSLQAAETTAAPGAVGNVSWLGTPQERKTADAERSRTAYLKTLDPNSVLGRAAAYEQGTGHAAPAAAFADPNQRLNDKKDFAEFAAGLRPDSPDHFTFMPKYDDTGKQTGMLRANTRTGAIEDAGSQLTKPTKANPQLERQAKLAQFAGEDIDAAQQAVNAAEDAGLLGPANGRLIGQFLGGTIGSTGDPEVDKKLGGLRGAVATVNQSYPPAISGSVRGAGGVERLKGILNTDKFSVDELQGVLDEMKRATTRRTPSATGSGGGGLVHMKAPDGRDLQVPADKVPELQQKGATVVK